MRQRLPLTVLVCIAIAFAISSCGGGSGGNTGTTPTSPSTTNFTISDAAPTISEALSSTITAALTAGAASAQGPSHDVALLDRLLQLFTPVTLHAQSSNFVANCSRGGSTRIMYAGGLNRPVTLSGTQIVFSDCQHPFRTGSLTFSGTLTANGIWTASAPGPVGVNGNLTFNTIGVQVINCFVQGPVCNGLIGGIRNGAADTPPPPNPNSCPATLTPASIQANASGGTFTININVGATCTWSVTGLGGSFITLGGTNSGTGPGAITVTVAANSGEQRTGSVSVAGTSASVVQAGASAAENAVGQWSGQLTTTTPCSNNTTTQRVPWSGRLTLSGGTFTMVWTDQYFGTPLTRTFPAAPDFQFTISDGTDSFTLVGHFAADYRSLQGPFSGSIYCGRIPNESLTGSWNGTRTGP